jgi:hypothetical protein
MGINKDLNVDPYYDDFNEDKQFNRVLFKPSKAVQARELTQLQTILQKQVERFGSNVYKEGTVISGVNLTARDDINYVKLEDQVGFDNPALYNEITDEDGRTKRYKLVGKTNGLEAEILIGLNGFETQTPNLKTFFINYLKSDTVGDTSTEVKEFAKGEKLELRDWNDTPILIGGSSTNFTTFGANTTIQDHVGKSFAIGCDEGVIYQKGHFIFVEKQLIIVTRYSNTPGRSAIDPSIINPVSVGFTVAENIVDSNQDSSLLDNAAGFNNYNAPGADRLQLVPQLVSYDTASEPEEFFALIRYTDGNPTRIRDFTEFSTIGDELARRTYEESGNFVVDGLDARLDKDGDQVEVDISPGKAYIFGREVSNVSNLKIDVDPALSSQSKTNQKTGVSYGQYYEINALDDGTTASTQWDLNIDGSNIFPVYNLYNSSDVLIGTCNVLNVVPVEGQEKARVYVYNILKNPAYANEAPTQIAKNLVDPAGIVKQALVLEDGAAVLYGSDKASMIFDTGKNGLNSVSDVVVVQRKNVTVTLDGVEATIPPEENGQPLANGSIFAITSGVSSPEIKAVSGSPVQQSSPNAQGFTGLTVSFSAPSNSEITIFYDFALHGSSADTLEEKRGFVSPVYSTSTKQVALGIPNVIELVRVSMADENGNLNETDDEGQSTMTDITSRFRLVNNQKDGVYDYSYLRLKTGEQSPETSNNLLVEFKYLDRVVSGGYLTTNSYPQSLKDRVSKYTAKNVTSYNLLESIDFRPYAKAEISVASQSGQAPTPSAPESNLSFRAKVGGKSAYSSFANEAVVSSTQSYYLSRIDSVVLDEYGNTLLIKGGEAESPEPPELDRQYGIANIIVPGGSNDVDGENRIYLESKTNSNYTMSDIENLEDKLDKLTDLVTLSMAESEAKSLMITGADGEQRFKNGILADSFNDLTGADFIDPEFNASIDKSKRVAMPAIREFPIDLKVDTDTETLVNVTGGFEDVTTLAITNRVSIINQPYATNVRNCVSNYYSYNGRAAIYPSFVSHRDVTKNPKIHINTDVASSVLDLVDNIQKFVPLTRSKDKIHRLGSTIDRVNRTRGAPTRVTNFVEKTTTTKLRARIKSHTKSLGSFVTDVSMKPYLKQHCIRIAVSGLRPNTVHHFFFGGKNVDSHVRQWKYNYRKWYAKSRSRSGRSGPLFKANLKSMPFKNWHDWFQKVGGNSAGSRYSDATVRTDSEGNLLAFFLVPRGTFFVGQNKLEISDVSQYTSIDSGGTSYACQTHRGYNLGISKSEINNTTRTVDFDTVTSAVVKREFQTRRRDPIAQTFRLRSSDTGNANFGYISDIDVYFRRVSSKQGVTLQIREAENGYPTSKVLPFAEAYLDPSDSALRVSADGTVPTKFEFANPVRLKADVEYCFVVIPSGNSPEYLIYTSKVGETSLSKGSEAKGVAVTNDWGDGVLFTSTNDSTWKSYQDEDLKFTINRYNFTSSAATVDLIPNDVEFLNLRDNKSSASSELVHFEDEETVYVATNTSFIGSMGNTPNDDNESPEIITVSNSTLAELTAGEPADGDYLILSASPLSNDAQQAKVVARIESSITGSSNTEITIDTPYYSIDANSSISVNCTLAKAATVSHYDPENASRIHLTESSARLGNHFDDSPAHQIGVDMVVGQTYTITELGTGSNDNVVTSWQEVSGQPSLEPKVGTQFVCAASSSVSNTSANGKARPNDQRLIGLASGAEATISSCDSQAISYFQPQIQIDNTTKTSTKVELYKKVGDALQLDKPISVDTDVYVTNNPRVIVSKSKQIELLDTDESLKEDFRLRVTMSNDGFKAVTPTLDDDLSNLNVYEYEINNVKSTPASSYISKEVILNPEMPAEGLRVLLKAYRPPGTHIDVYARFILANDSDNTTDWIELKNSNLDVYSALNNQENYREYEYNYSEPSTATPYTGFQIKLSLRHSLDSEMTSPVLNGIQLSPSLFPHISDYRAVAVN